MFWTSISFFRSIDGIDQFSFDAPFDPENVAFRQAFEPFTYLPLEVAIDDDLVFSGVIVGVNPVMTDAQRVITVTGYSFPGVLNDCTASIASFPTEFNGQTLKEIATTLCEPFGVFVDFAESSFPVFEKVSLGSDEQILPFLIKIAKQQGLILTNTEKGKLRFEKLKTSTLPVARLAQGFPPLTGISVNFSAQNYFSHLTALKPASVGVGGEAYTARNGRLEGVLRPFNFVPSDATDGTLKEAAEAKMGRMFAGSVSYSVDVVGWRDSKGALWAKNTLINVRAPGVMIYEEFTFLVASVEFLHDSASETARLRLVLPESFSAKIPEAMPWD